ncbi:hypothetical protein BH09VER1_BH09VER1_54440 [soil metagenome]
MKKLALFSFLFVFTLSGCMGIHQLSPAPMGANVDHAKSPSGKDLTKENDPPSR